MNLVIVESPAKCGKIQGFLGNGYRVIASLGHIRHLKEDLDSVGIDRDFEPTFEFMKEKAKAIGQIKDAAKGAKVFLASDDDREGELISYSVCLLLGLNPATTPRAVFHEITETAVTNAIKNPRLLDMNKVRAAEARAILDMMIGFTMSPLLWKSIGPGLSAGRCQTPALRLVTDRDTEITKFKASHSWKIHGQWSAKGASWPAHLTDELEDEESARAYLENHYNDPSGTIKSAETKPWTEQAPPPLITSTLQQQASTLFRSQPKTTMQIAQRLYEAGHITYMRTDKAILSEEAVLSAQEHVKATYGAEYNGSILKKKKLKKEVATQDAHEAIRPTHFDLVALSTDEDWSAIDRKVYQLIWLRAVQSVMAAAKGDNRVITFIANGDEDFEWKASWRKTNFLGWRKASTKETTVKEETEEDADAEADSQEAQWVMSQSLKPGTIVTWSQLQADPHETKASQRYSEASLIRELEGKGIGRPSTFAALISTIMDKKYVETKTFPSREREILKLTVPALNSWPPNEELTKQKVGGEKDRLTPTPLGSKVLSYLTEHFDDLFDYSFTAQMESRLDKIAEGTEEWKQVLRDTWSAYKDRYQVLKSAKSTVAGPMRREFGDGLIAVNTKKGPLLLRESADGDKDKTVFYGWPPSVPTLEGITEQEAKSFVEKAQQEKQGDILGTHDGHQVIRKSGKFGNYVSWNGKTVSCQADDTLETLVEKLTMTQTGRVVGAFEIRTGQYGPYMFKKDIVGKSRKFVSIPSTVNLEEVTEAQLIAIFQHQLQNKARAGSYGQGQGNNDQPSSSSASGRGRGSYRGSYRGSIRGRGK